jgi:hypothetical protein
MLPGVYICNYKKDLLNGQRITKSKVLGIVEYLQHKTGDLQLLELILYPQKDGHVNFNQKFDVLETFLCRS